MSSENAQALKIPQFDGTNFSNWKYRVGILLDEKNLRNYIEKDIINILADEQKAEKHDGLRLEEKKCVSILVQTIKDSQLEYVKEKKSAKEMFDALCEVFERKSVASQLLLRKQLLMMKYHDGDEMIEHFVKFDTKIRELKSTGAKMEELDVVVHLLLTLPDSYDNLVTALETMNQTNLTLQFVKTRLIDENNKRNGRESSGKSNEPGAMRATGKRKRLVCYGCGKPGHIKSKCRASKGGQNSDNGDKGSNRKVSTMCALVDEREILCNPAQAMHTANVAGSDTMELKLLLDSGATQHMVNDEQYFDSLENVDEININIAKKNQSVSAKQQGDISVKTLYEGDTSTAVMKDVLLVKDLPCNLMSIRSLTKKGYRIVFEGDYAYGSIDGKTKFVSHARGNLYEVILHIDRNAFAGVSGEDNINKFSQNLWHYRMGHLNAYDMKKMIDSQMVNGLKQVNVDIESKFCESCIFGKQTRTSFPKNKNARSTRILELIHSDVCGPMRSTAYDGSKYFATFTDDFSRASMVYFMEKKSQTFEKFKEFQAMAEALHNMKIAKLKVDNGGEYTSNEFKSYCKEKGIQVIFTVPHNPEMNSVSERLNRTLQDKATTMLLASNLDEKFWNEAILTANYLKNRAITSAVGKQFNSKTPAEIWFKQKPDLSHLRIFGSECFNHIPTNNRSKFEAKATKCLMLGYAASMGTYRLWDTEKKKFIVGRHVTFNEASVLKRIKLVEVQDSEAASDQTMCKNGEVNKEAENDKANDGSSEFHDTDMDGAGNNNAAIHGVTRSDIGDIEDNVNSATENCIGNSNGNIRRGQRDRKPVDRYMASFVETGHFALSAVQYVENDPVTIEEAQERDDWPQWQEAIQSEYTSLIKNKTWSVCDLPVDRKAITNKWVFKLKRKADGRVDKYKARLVARGFTQKFGFDYSETYAPVAKLVTLKVLLAVANHRDMHIHQMDVKSAFLNGELTEDIYMELPEGFKQNNKVCKLNKALYGLKQASRAWNEKFNDFMIRNGFKQCNSDACLYVKVQNGITIYVLLYVDDILIFCSDLKRINTVKSLLSNEFEMTDMGKASTFLGMHIEQDIEKGTIVLSQSKYLEKVLQKFNMQDCKPKSTPMEKGLHLDAGDKNKCTNHPYRELIGCLIYATVTTRPDLCAATGYFSRFQSCFNESHFNYARHILRYIRGTIDLKLVYQKQRAAATLIGYSDSDWGGDQNDGKSTSGYVFKLFGHTVSWASRKQATVSLSSTEAEYVALTEAICELKWIRKLLAELEIDCAEPVVVFEDNQSCIKIADEPKERKRMKHLNIKYHFIREAIANNEVELQYKSTDEQVADIMTKALGRNLFIKHRENLNLI